MSDMLSIRQDNLPAPLTSFIGRESEVVDVERLLATARLLTLTGAGGVGKTRLSQEVAVRIAPTFRDGGWLVELASLADPTLVPEAVAATLDIRGLPGRPLIDSLVEALHQKHLLLVLDNCEHIVDACAALVRALLRACPSLKVLATSRSPLRLYGEHEFPVRPLAVPDLEELPSPDGLLHIPAVSLFVHRARAVRPEFQLTGDNARSVAMICHRIDGLPLAIELAAARVKMLVPSELLARLNERFRVLVGNARDLPPRHLAIRDAIGWSYDLLKADERVLYRRLAVFAGGWSLAAAEQICAGEEIEQSSVLDLLTGLVDQSLVHAEQRSDATRYRFLETVREYGLEKLREAGEEAAVRDRHRRWFLDLAERAGPEVWGREQATWLRQLDADLDNFRSALALIEAEARSSGDPAAASDGLRLAWGLARFWEMRGYVTEGRAWLVRLLDSGRTTSRPHVIGVTLLGHLAWVQGDFAGARPSLEEGLSLSRALADPFATAFAAVSLGGLALAQGDLCATTVLLEEAAQAITIMPPDVPDRRIVEVMNSFWRAELAQARGDEQEAAALFEDCASLTRDLGDRVDLAYALVGLAGIALRRGNHEAAEALHQDALRIRRDFADQTGIRLSLEALAVIAVAQGNHPRAVRLLGAAEAIGDATGNVIRVPQWQVVYEHASMTARDALPEDEYSMLWRTGKQWGKEQALDYALESASSSPCPPHRVDAASTSSRMSDPLTERECEVANLIARGYTSRRIATELTITERTAETHARNIREKLGFNSRAQIATWVAEQGRSRQSGVVGPAM